MQAPPDYSKHNEVKARLSEVVKPAEIPIRDLGRHALATCTPKGGESFSLAYKGVSERGATLDRSFVVSLDKGEAGHGTPAGTGADGRRWRFQESLRDPLFQDPDDADAAVGPSEDMRIREALRTVAIAYVDDHPHALAAFEVIRQFRRLAMQDASVIDAEAALRVAREAAAATRLHASELEEALAERMSEEQAPSPSP